MRCMDEVKCHICKRIFCCAKCRQKHQFNTHAIAVSQKQQQPQPQQQQEQEEQQYIDMPLNTNTIYVFCPICEQKPLTLRKEMYSELLAHIETVHLPLRCRKCFRHYTKIDDLRDFSKCVNLTHNCSDSTTSNSNNNSSSNNNSCDTDASKITVKHAATVAPAATVAANTISTQTSPCIAKDLNQQQLHLTPISLFNMRWRAKSRHNQDEFISDSVSSIRNLSTDSVNLSLQRRSIIGQSTATNAGASAVAPKGKVIRSTSTPLQVCSMFAKPKETLAFNATSAGSAHLSSIYHSGYVLDEHSTPATTADNSQLLQPQQPQQRAWKVGGRGKMSAVTPLRQVMSKSIQKAFVELATSSNSQEVQHKRMQQDLIQTNDNDVLDLRLSPVVRRTEQSQMGTTMAPYQILLSSQKLTTESIIITRTQQTGNRSNSLPVATMTTNATVYNSCESVEIITAASSSHLQPITPITRVPGAIIQKKLIKFETPHKQLQPEQQQTSNADDTLPEDKEIFYTPNPASPALEVGKERCRREQIVPRQLSEQFGSGSPKKQQTLRRPLGPKARPPLRDCQQVKSFSCVQDVQSDEEEDVEEDEVFVPNSASTHNDNNKKRGAVAVASSSGQETGGRLWSLMSSMIRLPATLRPSDADKENTSTSGSLIRRCASIAGSLVRTMHGQDPDEVDVHSMKRKRTQTMDNQYSSHLSSSPASSSKRLRIQPRKPIERMRNNY